MIFDMMVFPAQPTKPTKRYRGYNDAATGPERFGGLRLPHKVAGVVQTARVEATACMRIIGAGADVVSNPRFGGVDTFAEE